MGDPGIDSVGAWDRYWASSRARADQGPGAFTRWGEPLLAEVRAATILDLGCGPGRDLCFLLTRGFAVVGVDFSWEAVRRARSGIDGLPAEVAGRGSVLRADLRDGLRSLASGSFDAVHAAVTYQGLSDGELLRVFDGVRRVLRPGGLHLWSVRSDRHPDRAAPERVAPNRSEVPTAAPLRFFSAGQVDALTGAGFRRWRSEEEPRFHSFYLADRTPDSPITHDRPVGR